MVEPGLIVFALYAILLMREFEQSGSGQSKGIVWAIGDIFMVANFTIAVMAAVIGCVLVELLPKKL
jgi:hypothetical protein